MAQIASMPASAVSLTPSSAPYRPSTRGRADEEPVDPVDRVVRRVHRELVALAEPAPDRLPQLVLQVGADDTGTPARPGRR